MRRNAAMRAGAATRRLPWLLLTVLVLAQIG